MASMDRHRIIRISSWSHFERSFSGIEPNVASTRLHDLERPHTCVGLGLLRLGWR